MLVTYGATIFATHQCHLLLPQTTPTPTTTFPPFLRGSHAYTSTSYVLVRCERLVLPLFSLEMLYLHVLSEFLFRYFGFL